MRELLAATTEHDAEALLVCLVIGLVVGGLVGLLVWGIATGADRPDARKWGVVSAVVVGAIVALFCVL